MLVLIQQHFVWLLMVALGQKVRNLPQGDFPEQLQSIEIDETNAQCCLDKAVACAQ